MPSHDRSFRPRLIPPAPEPDVPSPQPLAPPEPSGEPLAGFRYLSAPIQRQDRAPAPPEAAVRNGITAGENQAVQALSGGRVDLHATGAELVQVPEDDARLQAAQARSIAQGRTALVSHAEDRGHELWHLAQQAISQVPTEGTLNGQPQNDALRLEQEADRMGTLINASAGQLPEAGNTEASLPVQGVVQGVRTPPTSLNRRKLRKDHHKRASKVIKPDSLRVRPDYVKLGRAPVISEKIPGGDGVSSHRYMTRLRLKRQRYLRSLREEEPQDSSPMNVQIEPENEPEIEPQTQPEIQPSLTQEQQAYVQMLTQDAVVDLLQQSGGTAEGEWAEILPRLHGDMRKGIAATVFQSWLVNNGNAVEGELVQRKLEALQRLFNLSHARLESFVFFGTPHFSAAFAASPAVYVPLVSTATRSPYRTGHKASTDTLKPVNFDADKPTPAGELITQFNKHFAGKVYDSADPSKKIDKLKDTQKNQTLLSSIPKNKYDRPGTVEATITTPKPTAGRTGSGETEIGWFGGDEEQIIEGTRTVPYEGGHLIGDQLMDGDNTFDMYKSWNLAPQAKSFNNPLYITAMENAAVKALKSGASLDYKVEVAYPSETYKVKSLDAVTHAVEPSEKMSSGDTFVQAVTDYIKSNPTFNTDFTFLSRVPNYWKAEMSDTAGKGIAGSGRNDPRGPYSTTAIGPTTSYKPTGVEQFTFSLAADGTQLTLPTKGPKKKQNLASYSGATTVTLSARQRSFVTAPPPPLTPLLPLVATGPVAPKLSTMSVTDINKIVKYQSRAQAIYNHLQTTAITKLDDLATIKGVSIATVNLLKTAGVVP